MMMMKSVMQKFGSLWIIGQGMLAAVAPKRSAKFGQKMLDKYYENTDALTPKPAYLRQLRALGVGMIAAGIAGLLLEATDDDEEPVVEDDE